MAGHAGELYGTLPCYTIQGKIPVYQTNQDASYTALPPGSLKPWALHNNLPYDRNWGRSVLLPLNRQADGVIHFADDRDEPAIPLATKRETDYRQLSHSAVDELPIKPYYQLY
jgi:hypothetical protein